MTDPLKPPAQSEKEIPIPPSQEVVRSERATLIRLENQICWYDRRSRWNRSLHKSLKTFTIAAAAIIPNLTTSGVPHGTQVAAGLGILIAVFEGIQQLNQFQSNWASYRTTAESLERERAFYLAGAGPYAKAENAQALLAERVEALIAEENAKWLVGQSHVITQAHRC